MPWENILHSLASVFETKLMRSHLQSPQTSCFSAGRTSKTCCFSQRQYAATPGHREGPSRTLSHLIFHAWTCVRCQTSLRHHIYLFLYKNKQNSTLIIFVSLVLSFSSHYSSPGFLAMQGKWQERRKTRKRQTR